MMQTPTIFTSVISLLQQAVMIGGGLWTIWGAIVLAGAMKDHNGPGMQAGIWQIVGGLVVLGTVALFGSLTVPTPVPTPTPTPTP